MSLSAFSSLGNQVLTQKPVYFDSLLYYYGCNQTVGLISNNLISRVGTVGTSNAPTTNCSISSTNPAVGDGSLSVPGASSAYVDMSNKLNFSSGSGIYSLTMWFKSTTTASPANFAHFAVFSTTSIFTNSIMLRINYNTTNQINEYVDGGANVNISAPTSQSATNLRDGNWHHLAWVGFGNSTTRTVYIDGVLWGSGAGGSYTSTAVTLNATGTASRLGSSSWDTVADLNGSIDDVQIYSGTLTAAQVSNIYTNKTTANSCVFYYSCNTNGATSGTTGSLINGVNGVGGAGLTNEAPLNASVTSPSFTSEATIVTTTYKFGDGSVSIPNNPRSCILMNNKVDFSSGTGIYSLTMWFRTTSTSNYVMLAIFSSTTNGASALMLRLSSPNNALNEYSDLPSPTTTNLTISAPTSQSATNLRDGNWHHLAWIGFGNSTTRTLYIDNVLWGSGSGGSYTSVAVSFNATGTASRLGDTPWIASENLNGNLDEIQIYRGTLTAAQVNTIYNGNVL
jgi:hypothetical protein